MTRISKDFYITNGNACQDLQACLDEISNPSLHSTTEWFGLTIDRSWLSPPVLALLVKVLNQPLSKAGAGSDNKWDQVQFKKHCMFARRGVIRLLQPYEGFCSADDKEAFASSVATRASSIIIHDSPDILECLFNTPSLVLKGFHLIDINFNFVKGALFADWVQRCVSMNDLHICGFHFSEPLHLAQVLADASNLESICLRSVDRYDNRHVRTLGTLFCKDGGNGSVSQLLHPQSRLQRLFLPQMALQDCHFLTIVELLPTSQLQVLDVHGNDIEHEGILAFASQLPRIKCLKKVALHRNHWCCRYYCSSILMYYDTCMVALFQGMIENDSLECFEVHPRERDGGDDQLEYCTYINRVRRLTLASSNCVPVGLWPLILETVVRGQRHTRWNEALEFQAYRMNALYFVLRNCAIPLFTRQKSIAYFKRHKGEAEGQEIDG